MSSCVFSLSLVLVVILRVCNILFNNTLLAKVHEFEISRMQAEKVLLENGADLEKALRALVANVMILC